VSKYIVSPEADADLVEIWEYVAQGNFDAADRWIAKLREAIEGLAHNPAIGHSRNDLTAKPLLYWPVGAYLIIYRVKKKHVEIVAVTQGARDIPSFLGDRLQ
jgi:plasmid stabilization system protein ParE